MKILLYFENEDFIKISGVGRAFEHQKRALTSQGITYTTDPWDEEYDILHINTYTGSSEAVIKSAREKGKKVIYHAHSTKEDFQNSFIFSNAIAPFYNSRLVSLYAKADSIITPTPYSKKLLKGYGLKQPIHAISNGVMLEKYAYDEEKVKAFRKYFSLKEGDKVVIGVGLLFKRKGLLDFIEVARQLPQYKFIWFGDINHLVVTKDILDAIHEAPYNVYFPGYVKGPIIEGAYSDASCFFFPSYEETEGIVVLEALASRCPMLLRDIGAYSPWLHHGVNTYMGSTNEEFVSLLKGIVEKDLPDLIEQGYQVAKERNIENIGRQLKKVYEAVLQGNDTDNL